MALKLFRSVFTVIFVLTFVFSLLPVSSVKALNSHDSSLPSLDEFVSQVKNGQVEELRGIYIPELLAASVVPQPAGQDDFVSPIQNVITQFELASQFGSTGLLAHNFLAGERFFQLEKNQKFYLVYGDGKIVTFIVREILHYQALEPTSVTSRFVDPVSGDLRTASELFLKVYKRPGRVIFQTCITQGDDLNWGRLFVIAEPYFPKKS